MGISCTPMLQLSLHCVSLEQSGALLFHEGITLGRPFVKGLNLMSLAPCRIYIDELQNQALAEAYCDRIYAKAMAAKQGGSSSAEAAGLSGPGPNAKQPDSIYLQLIQV